MMIRSLLFTLSLAVTVSLVYLLGTRSILPAPLGRLLSPQEGVWANAEPVEAERGGAFRLPGMKGKVEVSIDGRLVPHVFAEHEADAYRVQGYLHAKHRLWQMEFQTHAAAGRISEIVGDKAVDFDRNQRRIGMVYAAENALRMMEADSATKAACDAYTEGVNAYIASLDRSRLPVEYKLLGYEPEKWSNLKVALFMKAMTNDLAGYDRDFEFTHALQALGSENFRMLFPEVADSLYPVVPKGTPFARVMNIPQPPAGADSAYFRKGDTNAVAPKYKPDPSNGSNNWAVSGKRTRSGRPILSNDPHLRLSLPSIWYEMQIHVPAFNAYGVSFPGIPGIVIGFNSEIAFGFTNAGRDVKDYYRIRFRDDTRNAYWFDGDWKPTENRIERILVKDGADVLDTVPYTVFGPVVYDRSRDPKGVGESYALRWVAHDTSNVLKMWHLLNRAKNYVDYMEAIRYFNAPGQNILFASRSGDIGLIQQATFPLRWEGQGLFVMPGEDSGYMWKGFIPMEDNPRVVNPAEGYVSSANQRPVDSTYPYFIPGQYDVYRGVIINRRLASMDSVTPEDMMRLQNDNYNVFAEYARPILLKHVDTMQIGPAGRYFLQMLSSWNLQNDPSEKGPTVFTHWWDSLQQVVFQDDLNTTGKPAIKPERFVLLEGLLRDTAYRFIDDRRTFETEDIRWAVNLALKKAMIPLDSLNKAQKLAWGTYKNTTVYHLLRNNAMSFARGGLKIGGGVNIINATTHDHGPSWKMVVHMTDPIEAYAVYPGGQEGNPGSPFYDSFVDTWTRGNYYRIWFMTPKERSSSKVKWTMTFIP